ncbi:hypothetical protein P12x_000316 [Tundrisphaera lichenicola]|uniref:hypothetical protein n=1 Tax=Tundrisphaera lichenicola TaxID=2029860 RepID=UPI003EB89D20
MIAMVAIVEAIIAGRRLDFTTVWADDWRQTTLAATSEAPGRDVLCFGDSLVKFGVLPRVIQAKTGLKSYNLALNAGTMPSAYFLLRRSLASGARPKAIVADFFALMLADQPTLSVRTYPDLASVRDCLDLAWTAGDPDLFTSTTLGKVLPSYKCRHEIRASVIAALDGRRASPWPVQSAIWKTWTAQNGAQPMPPVAMKPPLDPSVVDSFAPGNWSCDRLNAAYFEKFLKLAGEHHLPVYWLMPPLDPEVHARRAAQGSDQAYARMAREAQDRYPNLTVLDARNSGYDASVHIDSIHLDKQGAQALSGDLASILKDRVKLGHPGSRWVNMPTYDPNREERAEATVDAPSARTAGRRTATLAPRPGSSPR